MIFKKEKAKEFVPPESFTPMSRESKEKMSAPAAYKSTRLWANDSIIDSKSQSNPGSQTSGLEYKLSKK
jgi:uncharacterized protein YbaP (TraB family)